MSDAEHDTPVDRWRLRALRAWALIGIAVLGVAGIWLMARFWSVLTPFVFAMLVVFLLRRPVARLSQRGLSRALAVGVCYLIMLGALSFLVVVVLPPLARQFKEFLEDFPSYFAASRDLWFRLQVEYTDLEAPKWVQDALYATRDELAQQAGAWSRAIAGGLFAAGGQVATFFVNLFLSLMLAFFSLRDLPVIKEEILLLGGLRRRGDLLELSGRVTAVVEGWLRGQSMIALIIGVLTWLGLQLLGVPYALIIGLIAGVTNLIPYLGPVVAGVVAAISAAFVSPVLVVWTVLYIVVLQQLESMFLQPRVMSEQVNLHPVLVVFSLLIGASVGGVVGMILALPAAAAINVVFVYYFEKHTQSELATPQGALFRVTSSECEDSEEACDDEASAGNAADDKENE